MLSIVTRAAALVHAAESFDVEPQRGGGPALVLVSGALADERFTTFTGYNSATCLGDVKYLDHVSSCAPVDSKWATVSCNDTHATLVKFDADGCTGTASSTEYMELCFEEDGDSFKVECGVEAPFIMRRSEYVSSDCKGARTVKLIGSTLKTCNVPRNDDAPRDRHYYEKNDTHVITKKYAEADDDCSGATKADDEEPIGSCFVGTPSGSVFIEVPGSASPPADDSGIGQTFDLPYFLIIAAMLSCGRWI